MADDISKKYAVNIDLNVNSSNLDKLNDAENILDKAFSEPQKQSHQESKQSIQQVNVDTSAVESKLEKIISIISSQEKESRKSLDEAVVRAMTDVFKTSLLDIFRNINSAFSANTPQHSVNGTDTKEENKPVKTTKSTTIKTDTHHSDMAASNEIQLATGNTANVSAMKESLKNKTENTTGVSVDVVKNSGIVSKGAIATTIHEKNPSIHVAGGVDRISEYASMPHEYLHVLQQSKMFNTNSFLSNVFGGGGSFSSDVIKKANEFVTNIISSVRAALDSNLSDVDFDAIKNTYINSIARSGGIGLDIASMAVSSVDMLRGLNISPESMSGIIGNDIFGISSKNGTELERAILSSNNKNISVKNGKVFDRNIFIIRR